MAFYDGILKQILQSTLARYSHDDNYTQDYSTNTIKELFWSNEEREFARVYMEVLDQDGRNLFVRLFQRQDSWIRQTSIDYSDCGDISQSIQCLTRWQLLVTDDTNDPSTHAATSRNVEIVLNQLQLPHLQELTRKFHAIPTSPTTNTRLRKCKKNDFIQALLRKCRNQRDFMLQPLNGKIMLEACKLRGKVVRISPSIRCIIDRFLLVYLSARTWQEVSLQNEVLSQANKRRFPSYRVASNEFRIFRNRSHLRSYENALRLESCLEQLVLDKRWQEACQICEFVYCGWDHLISMACDSHGFHQSSSPLWFLQIHYESGYVYTRLLSNGLVALARNKQFELEYQILESLLSQPLFCQHHRGKWWCRLVLLVDRYWTRVQSITHRHHSSIIAHEDIDGKQNSQLERLKLVVQLCTQALSDRFVVSGHKRQLQLRQKKASIRILNLTKQKSHLRTVVEYESMEDGEDSVQQLEFRDWMSDIPVRTFRGIRIQATTGNNNRSLWLTHTDGQEETPVCVEEYALVQYRKEGWPDGIHCENSIFTTIFALLFWDSLFNDSIVGVFLHRFHSAPLDLNTEDFYWRRKDAIDKRLMEIETEEVALHIIEQVYIREYDVFCVGVNWDLPLVTLKAIIKCLGGSRLVRLMKYFCQSYRQARSGLPDLTLWNADSRQLKMVEVKGPNDTLKEHQELWLFKLVKELGVEVEICLIREADTLT